MTTQEFDSAKIEPVQSLSIPGIHSYIEVAKTAVGDIVCSYSYQVHRLTEKWRLSSGPSVTKPFIAQQTDGKNLSEVTKGVPYKVEKLTKMVNQAKFVLGLENISITWQKWPLDRGDHDRNGEYNKNRQSAGGNFNKIIKGGMVNLQKWWVWEKFTMGLANIQVRCQKWPLGKWRI